jgi:hypothetical protein
MWLAKVSIELLRPLSWFDDHGAILGRRIFIKLAEMNFEGEVTVEKILPCPRIEEGPGRLVTGRFSQERRGIWELKVEGDAEPIGVTPHHPLWSLDRHAWTSASELRPYERLATLTGPARLMYAMDTHIADPVYNIEVEGENCYRVGEAGTLVHNASGAAGITSNPCTNSYVVEAVDIDTAITCVGSQFPWTGKGPAPKWDNSKSKKAYGNFATDHGQSLTPQQLQNSANDLNNACRQTQFYRDDDVIEIEKRTPPCPGKYVIEMGRAIGRQFVRGGSASAPIEGLTKAFVGRRDDGTIFSIYPVRDAFQVNEGKCAPGPDLPSPPTPATPAPPTAPGGPATPTAP